MVATANLIRVENRLLAALPPEEFNRLLPHMEVVHMPQSEVVYEMGETIRDLYFPNTGMISLLSMDASGTTIEVGMVGSEGVLGLPVVLRLSTTPYLAMIQITADVVRIKGSVARDEFDRGGRFQDLLLRYTHVLLTQISQSAVCNRFHTIEKRLCRWLLIARDRVKSDSLNLTQEIIAHMLGTPRTGVTMAAVSLQRAGLISYSRGRITILDRKRMEATSCECYHIIKEAFENFIDG